MKSMTAKEFEALRKMMMRVAKYYLHSIIDAEEVVGRVIEKLAEGKFNVYAQDDLEKLLKKTVRNAAIDYKRSRRFKMRTEGKIISLDASYKEISTIEDTHDVVIREEKFLLLDENLKTLSPKEATLIQMKFMDGYSYEEIVPVLGGNVKSLCVMAGRTLKKMRLSMCA